jgi:hypothetical protein
MKSLPAWFRGSTWPFSTSTPSFDEILDALRRIPEHSLVITTEFLEDKTGNYFRKDEALSAKVRVTKAPFYSPYISDLVGRAGSDRQACAAHRKPMESMLRAPWGHPHSSSPKAV